MTFVQQVTDANPWSGTTSDLEDAPNPRQDAEAGAGRRDAEPFLSQKRRALLLNKAVEAEILPRLTLLRGRAATLAGQAEPELATTEADSNELVRRLLGADDSEAWGFIATLEGRGIKPAAIYLGVVTDAARHLGQMWEDDRCSFAQVTLSLGRLQQIVRAMAPGFQKDAVSRSEHAQTILLLPAPDEQHTFGLIILSEFFQREGWRVVGGPVSTGYDAPGMVRTESIDVVGFSLGSTKHLDRLAATIQSVRQASINRDIAVMVGGPLFLQRPELVARVGADTTASDAPSALRQARTMLSLRAAVH